MTSSPTLTWLRTAPEDGAALDAWCTAVGPVHAGAGAEAPAAALDSLVVVSWNVHVGGGDVTRLVADLRSGALTGGEPVTSFVLLLQEVHRSGPEVPRPASGAWAERITSHPEAGSRLDVVELARRLDLHVLYAPSMRNGADGGEDAEDRGNAILSSLPMTAPAAIELPYERQRRVAVAATVAGRTRGGAPWSLRVVSAHLDNRSRWSRVLDSFGASRTRQARALAATVTEDAAVVGADLNTWSAGFLEGALPLLRDHFPGTPEAGDPTFSVAGIGRRVDHLLLRLPEPWGADVRRVDERYGSDHHAVLGVVRLAG